MGVGVPAPTKFCDINVFYQLQLQIFDNFSKVVFLSEIFIRKSAYKNTTIYNFVLQIEDFFVAVSVCSFVHISM